MQDATKWLLDTLRTSTPSPLIEILSRHRSKEDDFHLGEVLSFMPLRQYPHFTSLIRSALSPSVEALKKLSPPTAHGNNQPSQRQHLDDHIATVRAASELICLSVRSRDNVPHEGFVDIIRDLHDVILVLPDSQHKNHVARLCEWLWSTAHPRRETIVPHALLFLLLRSFGIEGNILEEHDSVKTVSRSYVARIYAMREALHTLVLAEDVPEAHTMRVLLLRCTTSASYLRVESGCKFLAYLLTVEDIRAAVFQSLVNQIAIVRKTRASYYGDVFLYAWKLQKSDWLFKCLTELTEMAIYTASDPFGANMRTVLSSFHKSKRLVGVDQLLHRIYSPVLYKNLMVAHPIVRRNAVSILAESFPIHDPNTSVQDIQQTINFQCGRLFDLLTDPAPTVRKTTVEGTCRILGLLWELVPLAFAKRMLDTMTTKLAFDASSAQVRIAVFDGLKFIARNHLAYQILSIALPRLGPLIHDNVEKVRFSFLDLLLTLKSKRARSMRYFDVVPLDDLLIRLPSESPAAAAKIMTLIVSSYFPLERKGKTAEEIAASQVRACLSMLRSNKDACRFFYRNVYLHVPPGPLCEFAMRLSSIALESPDVNDAADNVESVPRKLERKGSLSKRCARHRGDDENITPLNNDTDNKALASGETSRGRHAQHNRVTLLEIVADVLSSISPSLEKQSNRSLRRYIDQIFGGEALRSLLIERGNSRSTRAVCWRVASCISRSQMQPIVELWHEQMDSVLDWHRTTDREIREFEALLSALVTCGFRWKMTPALCSVVLGWANASSTGLNRSMLGVKSRRRSKSTMKQKGFRKTSSSSFNARAIWPEPRWNALFALRCLASALSTGSELGEEFRVILSQTQEPESSSRSELGNAAKLVRSLRIGCLGAIDNVVESHEQYGQHEVENPRPQILLDCLSVVWKLLLGLLSTEQSSEIVSLELRELLEWTASTELLVGASKIDETFSRALGAMALRFSGDAVALGYLKENDMQMLERITSNIEITTDWSQSSVVTGPAAELLRLSYQLREHYSFVTDGAEMNKESFYPLLQTSISLLLRACDMLRLCKRRNGPSNGMDTKTPLLDGFMSETLLSFCVGDKLATVSQDLGEKIRSCCQSTTDAEGSLLVIVVCNSIRRLAITPPSGMSTASFELYESLVHGISFESDEQSCRRATMYFTWLLVQSIFSVFEDPDAAPSNDMRHFLASLEVFLKQWHRKREHTSTNDDNSCFAEIRSILDNLQTVCRSSRDPLLSQGGAVCTTRGATNASQREAADLKGDEAADMEREKAVDMERGAANLARDKSASAMRERVLNAKEENVAHASKERAANGTKEATNETWEVPADATRECATDTMPGKATDTIHEEAADVNLATVEPKL